MIIEMNGKMYEMTKEQHDKMLKATKDVLEGRNTIFAISKPELTLMVNEEFKEKSLLMKAKKEYLSNGFKVYFVTK